MMKKIFCAFILLPFGIVSAHAGDVSEREMRAQMEQGHCPADLTHVRQVTDRERCQAVCGVVGDKLYNCSPGDDHFVGYEPECMKEVNRLNALINQYNDHLAKCKAGDKRGASRGGDSAPRTKSESSASTRPKLGARWHQCDACMDNCLNQYDVRILCPVQYGRRDYNIMPCLNHVERLRQACAPKCGTTNDVSGLCSEYFWR
jgi:hypothetical protein